MPRKAADRNEPMGLLDHFRKIERRSVPQFEMDTRVTESVKEFIQYVTHKRGWTPNFGQAIEMLLDLVLKSDKEFQEWKKHHSNGNKLPASKPEEQVLAL
jgi:hypothetical protein